MKSAESKFLFIKKQMLPSRLFLRFGNDPKRNFEKEGTLFRKNKEPKIYSSER